MARQKGVIKLEGQIGDLSFYKTQDGYLARGSNNVKGERIKTDPKFARTRENGAEFGRAGKAGKLLRKALHPVIHNIQDGKLTSRLTKEMMRVVKADGVSKRGERNVTNGNITLLAGFEFNIQAPFSQTFKGDYQVTFTRSSGVGEIMVHPFHPREAIGYPVGATHYRFVSASASMAFDNNQYDYDTQLTDYLSLEETVAADLQILTGVPPETPYPVIMVFGIEFTQVVNGQQYPLQNGAYNAMMIVIALHGV